MSAKLTEAQRRVLLQLKDTTDDYYGCKQTRSINARLDVVERLVWMGLAGWTKGVMHGVHITEAGRSAIAGAKP